MCTGDTTTSGIDRCEPVAEDATKGPLKTLAAEW